MGSTSDRASDRPDETLVGKQHVVLRNWPRIDWHDDDGPHSLLLDRHVIVGSATGSGIRLKDRMVSRVHAELEPRPDGIWVRDVGSRNGTTVEGVRVMNARAPDGGKIQIGSTEFTCTYGVTKTAVALWERPNFGPLVGSSIAMRELFTTLSQIAPSDAPVLIQGETGTGKELVARAIHDASPRAGQPFVVVDCAALPETLLDTELFGHVRGAFTGAIAQRLGAFELAEGGTVFLDEIGELPILMQPKLLRVLESKTVRRIGESEYRKIDVRFLAATHRDLPSMVSAKMFREDLYFRLAVLPINVPSLRDRPDDIAVLVQHFVPEGVPFSLTKPLLDEVKSRPWQGNVRELRNFVARAVALGPREALALSDTGRFSIPPPAPSSTASKAPPPPPPAIAEPEVEDANYEGLFKDFRERWVEEGEKEYLVRLLDRHQRNVATAAKQAGVDRTYLYRLIRKYDL